jgi:hypothetical protein
MQSLTENEIAITWHIDDVKEVRLNLATIGTSESTVW